MPPYSRLELNRDRNIPTGQEDGASMPQPDREGPVNPARNMCKADRRKGSAFTFSGMYERPFAALIKS